MNLLDLADEDFVSPTTFRRSGAAVPTTVWLGRDGDALVVITPASSGKLKRLAHTSRVELRPCSRRGKVEPGAPTLTGHATVIDDPVGVARVRGIMARKYGLEFRVFMFVERLIKREDVSRVGIRITA
ncbi:PPOX class F420-dependent oxidoreductase [Mariniluteicoccus flavus]